MKKYILLSTVLFMASCAPKPTPSPFYSDTTSSNTADSYDPPQGTTGALGEANIACIQNDGMLVGRRGGGVICKLPSGEIVDQMTLL